jgi:hypothetical protein
MHPLPYTKMIKYKISALQASSAPTYISNITPGYASKHEKSIPLHYTYIPITQEYRMFNIYRSIPPNSVNLSGLALQILDTKKFVHYSLHSVIIDV